MKISMICLSFCLTLSTAAMSHTLSGEPIGTIHIMINFNHLVINLLLGAMVALTMRCTNLPLRYLSTSTITLVLTGQFVFHAIQNGVLYGLEVGLGGAVLALLACTLLNFILGYIKARGSNTKTSTEPSVYQPVSGSSGSQSPKKFRPRFARYRRISNEI
jgi:hypothetical protein